MGQSDSLVTEEEWWSSVLCGLSKAEWTDLVGRVSSPKDR